MREEVSREGRRNEERAEALRDGIFDITTITIKMDRKCDVTRWLHHSG